MAFDYSKWDNVDSESESDDAGNMKTIGRNQGSAASEHVGKANGTGITTFKELHQKWLETFDALRKHPATQLASAETSALKTLYNGVQGCFKTSSTMALILYHGLDSAVQARSRTVGFVNAAYNLDPTEYGEKMEWQNAASSLVSSPSS